ncbi:MAG: 6-hydroxycyclohex-1-ene-1-carbonyl-CoA dehydrogenase [Planctomycetes bacterium]|nr:6-hydroxycyclohex-1-ene-1-carbonyl-CoA dehydrogenase [Planctomycetota bacterium]MCQ3948254.1 6-hydroxycyclohex-1-ene-1-carbonyl-CoA dehydrogenase [Planctomycetota bacterium]GIK52854.1 MAG: zinc-dependent alcohol dehydrogenase [Planctomycetota bacterium]
MKVLGYACREAGKPLIPHEYDLPAPGPDQALVRVFGCGVCHTDISFATGQVQPRHPLPLVLGHEIGGVVEQAGGPHRNLVGRKVIVPAVMPCGQCAMCRAGFENTCKAQFMPGNDGHGGFASHLLVPARTLAPLPDRLSEQEVAEISVIADAVTTPYQTMVRANLKAGEVAIVLGTGGIGTYGVQIAAALGATVFAIDIDDAKLARVAQYGAKYVYNSRGQDLKTARAAIRDLVKKAGLPDFGWKVFEMSGTAAGQELAFNLIPPGGTLAIVGFTMDAVKVRLSNLMALDAACFGNWGCAPKHYPAAIALVLEGRVQVKPFVKTHPLSQINEIFDLAHHGKLTERAVLLPGK